MALFVCAMLLVVLSGAFKPAIDMSALSASVRDEIRARNLKSSITAVCAALPFVFRCRVQPRT